MTDRQRNYRDARQNPAFVAGYNTPSLEHTSGLHERKVSKSGKKLDRYAQEQSGENSQIAEEDLKWVNSPPSAGRGGQMKLQTLQAESFRNMEIPHGK